MYPLSLGQLASEFDLEETILKPNLNDPYRAIISIRQNHSFYFCFWVGTISDKGSDEMVEELVEQGGGHGFFGSRI